MSEVDQKASHNSNHLGLVGEWTRTEAGRSDSTLDSLCLFLIIDLIGGRHDVFVDVI